MAGVDLWEEERASSRVRALGRTTSMTPPAGYSRGKHYPMAAPEVSRLDYERGWVD